MDGLRLTRGDELEDTKSRLEALRAALVEQEEELAAARARLAARDASTRRASSTRHRDRSRTLPSGHYGLN
jgi:hypothetical protein